MYSQRALAIGGKFLSLLKSLTNRYAVTKHASKNGDDIHEEVKVFVERFELNANE